MTGSRQWQWEGGFFNYKFDGPYDQGAMFAKFREENGALPWVNLFETVGSIGWKRTVHLTVEWADRGSAKTVEVEWMTWSETAGEVLRRRFPGCDVGQYADVPIRELDVNKIRFLLFKIGDKIQVTTQREDGPVETIGCYPAAKPKDVFGVLPDTEIVLVSGFAWEADVRLVDSGWRPGMPVRVWDIGRGQDRKLCVIVQGSGDDFARRACALTRRAIIKAWKAGNVKGTLHVVGGDGDSAFEGFGEDEMARDLGGAAIEVVVHRYGTRIGEILNAIPANTFGTAVILGDDHGDVEGFGSNREWGVIAAAIRNLRVPRKFVIFSACHSVRLQALLEGRDDGFGSWYVVTSTSEERTVSHAQPCCCGTVLSLFWGLSDAPVLEGIADAIQFGALLMKDAKPWHGWGGECDLGRDLVGDYFGVVGVLGDLRRACKGIIGSIEKAEEARGRGGSASKGRGKVRQLREGGEGEEEEGKEGEEAHEGVGECEGDGGEEDRFDEVMSRLLEEQEEAFVIALDAVANQLPDKENARKALCASFVEVTLDEVSSAVPDSAAFQSMKTLCDDFKPRMRSLLMDLAWALLLTVSDPEVDVLEVFRTGVEKIFARRQFL
jgi:hypothetical protein